MPKYRVLMQPSGLINGAPWPEVGGILEVEALMSGPHIELVDGAETRPAPTAGIETRGTRTRKRVAKP